MNLKKESLIRYWQSSGLIKDRSVIEAFRKIRRENFMPKEMKHLAYEDNAFPLMKGQTISQPTTVMIMTQALEVKAGMKVLEIGTASGYQAALLSELVGSKGRVITTEIIPELYESGKKNLSKFKNVKVVLHDGSTGYKKEAPFDRIIVTAACREIPKALTAQLKSDGILVAPVGPEYNQKMIKLKKVRGKIQEEYLGDFVFVPLRGKYGSS